MTDPARVLGDVRIVKKGEKRVWKEVGENCKYTWHSEQLPNGRKIHFFSAFVLQNGKGRRRSSQDV